MDAVADDMYVSLLQESLHVSASMLETPRNSDSASMPALGLTAFMPAEEPKSKAKPKGAEGDAEKKGDAKKPTKKAEPKTKNRLGPEYTITYKFPKTVWAIFAMAGCTWVLSMVLLFFWFNRTASRRPLQEYIIERSQSAPTSPGGTWYPPLDVPEVCSPGGTYHRQTEPEPIEYIETEPAVEATIAQKCMAEAVGTFLNVLGGCSVGAADKYLHCGLGLLGQSIGWGVSVALSVFAAREVSGGHCNPACTVSMWFHNGFPLRHVPFYIFSQLCGAVLASSMVYGMFSGGITALEVAQRLPRGTSATTFAGAFGLVPGPPWLSGAGACAVEFVATTFLIFIVFTVTDWEGPVPKNAQPILIGTAVALMIAAFGALDGAGMNPARDTGPRIVCFFAGWGEMAFAFWWCYTLGPICGGIFGGWLYNRFFKTLSKQMPSPMASAR